MKTLLFRLLEGPVSRLFGVGVVVLAVLSSFAVLTSADEPASASGTQRPSDYKLSLASPITALAFAPGGREIVAGTTDGLIRYQWPSLTEGGRRESARVNDLKFSPDGTMLLAAGGDPADAGIVELFDWPTCRQRLRLERHRDVVYEVAWSPNGRHWATASADSLCHVCDADTGKVTATYRGHSRPALAITFLNDELIASAGVDETIQIWNVSNGQQIRTLSNHVGAVNGLLVAPQETERVRLISIGQDRTVRLWEPTIGRLVRFERIASLPQKVGRIPSDGRVSVMTRSGQLLTTDGSLRNWQQEEPSPAPEVGHVMYSLAFDPDTGRAIEGSADGKLWVEPHR